MQSLPGRQVLPLTATRLQSLLFPKQELSGEILTPWGPLVNSLIANKVTLSVVCDWVIQGGSREEVAMNHCQFLPIAHS